MVSDGFGFAFALATVTTVTLCLLPFPLARNIVLCAVTQLQNFNTNATLSLSSQQVSEHANRYTMPCHTTPHRDIGCVVCAFDISLISSSLSSSFIVVYCSYFLSPRTHTEGRARVHNHYVHHDFSFSFDISAFE